MKVYVVMRMLGLEDEVPVCFGVYSNLDTLKLKLKKELIDYEYFEENEADDLLNDFYYIDEENSIYWSISKEEII